MAGPPPAPPGAHPDRTAVLPPVDPERTAKAAGAFSATDPVDAPDSEPEYEATGGSEPLGAPEVWGASSYETGAAYPLGGYEENAAPPASPSRPPVFPTDPGVASDRTRPHRRNGVIAAAVGVMVLLGGGVAAAVTVGGSHTSLTTSGPPTSLPVPRSAHHRPPTAARTRTAPSAQPAIPAATPPTRAATTTAPATTLPPTTPATTVPPTTPATTPTTPPTTARPATPSLTLSTWTTQELNLILRLRNDLTTLNRDLYGQRDSRALTVDAADLQQDLQAAQSAPTPADPTVAQQWVQLLQDIETSDNDLNGALRSQDANIGQDLRAPLTVADTAYNNLSSTLNASLRHAQIGSGPGANGQGRQND